MRRRILGAGLVALAAGARPALAACETFATYRGVALRRFGGGAAYAWRTARMAIDADGAPNAYHPRDTGIDALGNAGFPNGGWRSVILPDPGDPSRPFVQRDGEFAGFFLSMTTLQDRTRPATDPARYVDSRLVPYIVFPGAFFRMQGTGQLGVLGAARNLRTGQTSALIFADVGAANHDLGEVSIRLAENLGGSGINPRTGRGMPQGPFAYVIFPGSQASPAWPRSPDAMQSRVDEGLAAIGGWDAVTACLGA